MNKKKYINWHTLSLLGALGVILILYVSSSMTYKQQTSVPFLEHYLTTRPFEDSLSHISFEYAGKTISIQQVGYFKFVEFFIRKGAHFGTYFLLGMLLYLGLMQFIKKYWFAGTVSLVLSAMYACFDEFHQYLTGDRTPLVQDVILDSCGALCGILLSLLVTFLVLRRRNRV